MNNDICGCEQTQYNLIIYGFFVMYVITEIMIYVGQKIHCVSSYEMQINFNNISVHPST